VLHKLSIGIAVIIALCATAILVVAVAAADRQLHDNGQCPTVHKWSHKQITCTKLGGAYLLNYPSSGVRTAVKWSGRYQEMLDTLCRDSATVVESIRGRRVRTYHCEEE
jgi:hypothetical protein